ncbi:MAG: hypothetical protein ACLU9S_15180 [Oscillospiraceae bacterium]
MLRLTTAPAFRFFVADVFARMMQEATAGSTWIWGATTRPEADGRDLGHYLCRFTEAEYLEQRHGNLHENGF